MKTKEGQLGLPQKNLIYWIYSYIENRLDIYSQGPHQLVWWDGSWPAGRVLHTPDIRFIFFIAKLDDVIEIQISSPGFVLTATNNSLNNVILFVFLASPGNPFPTRTPLGKKEYLYACSQSVNALFTFIKTSCFQGVEIGSFHFPLSIYLSIYLYIYLSIYINISVYLYVEYDASFKLWKKMATMQ